MPMAAVVMFGFCSCSKSSTAMGLLNRLLDNTTEDIRPGLDTDAPLSVNISYTLVALTELNEVKGYISTVGYLAVTWVDERMTWEPANYEGITSLTVDARKVWTPPLIISSLVDKIYTPGEPSVPVRYTSEGFAFWHPGCVMKTHCFIRIPAYPFDTHTCGISIINFGMLPSEAIIQSPSNIVTTAFYSENAEWALKGTTARATVAGSQLSMATFDLQFSRKPAFLIINILTPIVFLSLLNSFVFLLPQESGERVSFSITVLLSFTVFLNIIGDNVPKTSSPMPYLCYYVIIVLVSSGLITLLTILCQRLHHNCTQEPVPRWLQTCLFLSSGISQTKISDLTPGEDKKNFDHNSFNQTVETFTWKHVALKLDKFLFFTFFTVGILLALGFIIAMANTTK